MNIRNQFFSTFYCAVHYSAKRKLVIACRLSVRLWRWKKWCAGAQKRQYIWNALK